ncbi:LOW QUALITY PROTEIN: hypothetical protein U0070_013328, partial [Myodes glareolus]
PNPARGRYLSEAELPAPTRFSQQSPSRPCHGVREPYHLLIGRRKGDDACALRFSEGRAILAPEVLLGSSAGTSTLPACEVRPFRIAGISGSGRLRRLRPTCPDPRTRPRRCAAEGGHSTRKDVTGAARVADTPRREPARHGLGVLQRGPMMVVLPQYRTSGIRGQMVRRM